MRRELSNNRPSYLSGVFRDAVEDGRYLEGRSRHLDIDWIWYCKRCYCILLVIEEKLSTARENEWGATRRLALRHEDRPWAWRVTGHEDGFFSVVGQRGGGDSFEERTIDEPTLVHWIEALFSRHEDVCV